MKSVLVSGSSDGIGLEMVKQLARQGHRVFLTARSEEKAAAAKAQITEGAANVETLVLDTTSLQSVVDAAKLVAERTGGVLHTLINNAGKARFDAVPAGKQNPATADLEVLRDCFETNFFGTVQLTTHLLPLLLKAENPTIVFVSTDMASTTRMASAVPNPASPLRHLNAVAYNSSKAALNAYVVSLALAVPQARINAVTPGYTATKLNGYGKAAPGAKTTEAAAARLLEFAFLSADGPSGKYFSFDGESPW